MCEVKKLCTCDKVAEGTNHWRLEAYVGSWPSWGGVAETRPEHQELANEIGKEGNYIMGPMPMPRFKDMYKGIADKAHLELAIEKEEEWLNKENQFDFEYEPFDNDNLVYVINEELICFRYYADDKEWRYFPGYRTSMQDHRSPRVESWDKDTVLGEVTRKASVWD